MNKKILVIYHRADFDGIFCREIAKRFLGESAEYVGWDYGDEVPSLPPGIEQIYMLDISIMALMDDPRLIWIDHHKSAMEKFAPDIPGYRIDGVAACRLAWQWFNLAENPAIDVQLVGLPGKADYFVRGVSEPLAVRLAGEYDIWDKRDPRAETFQFGLRSRPLTDFDWNLMLGPGEKLTVDQMEELIQVGHPPDLQPDGTSVSSVVHGLLETGRIIQAYQQQCDADVMPRSFMAEFEGLQFLCLNTARCNSLTFAAKDTVETGHDALLGFYWSGEKWKVSLYHAKHNTGLDLSLIASKFGGGGHRGACGFQAETLPFVGKFVNPEILAGLLYNAYCADVGGKAFNGDPLPEWNLFRGDPSKLKQSKAWVVAASIAIETLK